MPNKDCDPSKLGDANTRASFVYDLNHDYGLRWANEHAFEDWFSREQAENVISFSVRRNEVNKDSNLLWIRKRTYICGRGHSGGKKKYIKKHNWTRKVPEQRIGCSCTLIVKTYPGTDELLGRYTQAHSHPMGNSNARFVPLPSDTRKEIARRLREGVDPAKVLEQIRGGVTSNVFANVADHKFHRNAFCTAADVRRIQKSIEAEMVRLAKQDGPSVVAWVQKLRAAGHYVFLKSRSDAPPPQSNVASDAFLLIIQTPYQKQCWDKYGSRFAAIDATHNTT
ncbi:hypothetical protein BKA70DRAFT_1093747, partial [Coprinopsis sp. MPI-PUGE-AT-0042]